MQTEMPDCIQESTKPESQVNPLGETCPFFIGVYGDTQKSCMSHVISNCITLPTGACPFASTATATFHSRVFAPLQGVR